MTGWDALDAFLRVDPNDMGCEEAFAMLHVYAEMVIGGVDVDVRYPGTSAHLRSCGPCQEDFEGLLAAISR